MPVNYRSFRTGVPWLLLCLQALLIVFFYFFFSGDDGSHIQSYPAFQDVNHMVVFGFGFFLLFLRRYGFSSTAFNLLMVALGVQCSALLEANLGLLLQRQKESHLQRIKKAAVSVTAVIISTGAVLGKANPVQLILMTIVEIIGFHVSRCLNMYFLQVSEEVSMMHVLLFGAYFGLAFSSRFSEPSPRSEKNRSTPKSDLLSMLGTLFLWVFWPSFSVVVGGQLRVTAIYNTYFALAVSAVTAFLLSALTTRDGKFRMTHIHSSVLAGGIAVGYSALSIDSPWIAMILGLLASVISVLGSHCLQRCLYPLLRFHDAAGVHFTFGLPAVLGAVAEVILLLIKNWTHLPSLGDLVLVHVGAVSLTISVALLLGFVTGFILNLRLFKTIPASKYFEDQCYWE
ncbi:RHD protein, partial [Rhinopomastus cyanomelas]|nr:RHD protein [Rhinopomastus cyanomelas]